MLLSTISVFTPLVYLSDYSCRLHSRRLVLLLVIVCLVQTVWVRLVRRHGLEDTLPTGYGAGTMRDTCNLPGLHDTCIQILYSQYRSSFAHGNCRDTRRLSSKQPCLSAGSTPLGRMGSGIRHLGAKSILITAGRGVPIRGGF